MARKDRTEKYRRRRKRERANRVDRKERTALLGKVESDAALAQKLGLPLPSFQLEPVPEADKRPVCPLCQQEMTIEEGLQRNVDVIEFNRRLVPVHKTCPSEASPNISQEIA